MRRRLTRGIGFIARLLPVRFLPPPLSVLMVVCLVILPASAASVTVYSVNNEPRGLAINLTTNKAVVTNHNTNTVTIADLSARTTTDVTVGQHPYGVAVNTTTNKAYIVNEKSDSVTVINLANNAVLATIAVGGNPKEIAVHSGTNLAVVANSKSDTVSIIDLATNTVSKTLTVGIDPEGVVINSSKNKAYVTNRGSDTVSVIDLATKTVAATLPVGTGPSGIDIQTASQRIVVANRLSDNVTIINGTNNTIVTTVAVGSNPADVSINTGTNRAYVSNTDSDSISVIDLSTNQVIATYPVGRNPEGVAVVPQYNLLLVVNCKGDTVFAIDLATPPTGTVTPVGRDPEGVAIDFDANTAVTANSKSNNLSVVDLATNSVLATLPAGKRPRDVAIHPSTKKLVSANYKANTASIFDLPSRTLLATVPVGKGPTAVAIDPGLNLAVVANERGDSLSLIDLSTHTVSATLAAGSHPTDIGINTNTHLAVVANKKKDILTLIDLTNRTTVGTVAVGKDPVSVAVNSLTNIAAVANEKTNTVSIVNLATKAVTATINVIPSPTGIAINPSTNVAGVVSHEKNLQTIDLSTLAVLTTYPAGLAPEQVAINPYTNVAAVTNEDPDPGALKIIQLSNPAPALMSLAPASAVAGGVGFTLTLNGSRFLKTSTVNFGAQVFTPQFISNAQLRVDLPTSAIVQPGAVSVTVTNPAPGGGTSNAAAFTVINPANPVPTATSISPNAALAGAGAIPLTLNGGNFVATSVVQFNGTPLPTTFVNATQLTASLPENLLNAAGVFAVTAVSPAPGGGVSNSVGFTVILPPPTGLAATDVGNDQGGTIALTWGLSPYLNITQQRVYRSPTPGGSYALVGSVAGNVPAFTDAGLANGTAYYYVVRAYDGTHESPNSNEVQATPLDNLPPQITLTTPADHASFKTATLTVTGTVDDPQARVTVNGISAAVQPTGAFSIEVPLDSEGANPIHLIAADLAGNTTPVSRTVIRDTASPTLQVGHPADQSYFKTEAIIVDGTVSDLTTSVATVTINGVSAAIADGIFSAPLTLTEGSNLLTVVATDTVGNTQTVSLTVLLDIQGPVIAVGSPAAGAFLPASPVTVSGSVTDASPITTFTLNGSPVILSSGGFSLSVPLVSGANTLTFSATDAAGNVETSTLAVTLDNLPPEIVISSPADGSTTGQPRVTLTGTVTEAGGLVETLLNGAPLLLTQGAFSVDVPLTEGSNSFTISAKDAAGNTSSRSLTLSLDIRPPAVTFTSPSDGANLNGRSLAVTGTIDDPLATVRINGLLGEIASGFFTISNLVLAPGRNDLSFTATDAYGNVTTKTLTVYLDDLPPAVRISSPAAGFVTTATVTVTGTVDDPSAVVTVNGVSATISNGIFTAAGVPAPEGPLTLLARAEDPAGNVGTDQTQVTVDRTAPLLIVTAPSETAAGSNVLLHADVSDPNGIGHVTFSVDGAPVASIDQAPFETAYTIPPSAPVGRVVSILAQTQDRAGLAASKTAGILINAPSANPGFVEGRVIDDAVGLPLAGAQVTLEGTTQVTGADGKYLFNHAAGTVLITVEKNGTTQVFRSGEVPPGQKAVLLDARLTSIDTKVNTAGPDGGTFQDQGGLLQLIVPAGALPNTVDILLTPISNQGLTGRLPLGWSPVAAVDLQCGGARNASCGFRSEAMLAVPNTVGLTVGRTIPAAIYDPAALAWRGVASGQVSNDGKTVRLAVLQSGQYIFLLPDDPPTAPPAPVIGELIQGFYGGSLLDPNLTATGTVVPKGAPPSGGGVHAVGEVIVASTDPLPSGTRLSAKVTEEYNLRDQTNQTPEGFTEDLLVYRSTPSRLADASHLSTKFPVTPSKNFTLKDLMLGKVTLGISLPKEAPAGTLFGAEGGSLTTADGVTLSIPAGALLAPTLVRSETETVPGLSTPAGYLLLKALRLDFTQTRLAQSARVSFPLPASALSSQPILIAKVMEIAGERRAKLIGFGKISGPLVVSTNALYGLTLPGLVTEGEYLILQPQTAIGFFAGNIFSVAGTPQSGVKVSDSGAPFVDLTGADGKYVVVGPLGASTLSAQDLAGPNAATQTATVAAANQSIAQNLALVDVPFAVASASPVNGATLVPLDTPIVVGFNRLVNAASLTANSVQLLELRDPQSEIGNPIEALLVPSTAGFTLYPRQLGSATRYAVTLTAAITDLFGKPLAPMTAQFITRNTTPPPVPPAGQITVSFPDANGFVTISATQGTIAAENLLSFFNGTTGEIASATVGTNGSFSGQIRADLGDELKLLIRDTSGNVTMADPGPYRAADGKTLVDKKGGVVRGEGDVALAIPPGAMEIPQTVKITPVLQENLPIPVPQGIEFLKAIDIDTGGASFQSEAKLSIPAPVSVPEGATPFLVRAEEIDGKTEYVIINSAKVENGRITTASPPFDGVLGFGLHLFLMTPPTQIPVILTGRVFKDANGNDLYDPENVSSTSTLKDLPVRRAIVRTKLASVGQSVPFPAIANAEGKYALYAIASATDWNLFASSLAVEVTATDPLSRVSKTLTISGNYTFFKASEASNRDIKLIDLSQVPDTTPPALSILVRGEHYYGGSAEIGKELEITLTATDAGGISATNLSFNLNPINDTLRQTSSCIPGGCTWIYRYTPQETGLFSYPVTIQAVITDDVGNQAEKLFSVSANRPGTILQPDPNKPPSVLIGSIDPPNGSIGVPVNQIIRIGFTEPVDINSGNLILKEISGATVDADYRTQTYNGQYLVEIHPKSNLNFKTSYQVDITTHVTDFDQPTPRALANPQTIAFTTPAITLTGALPLENARDAALFTAEGKKYLLVANDAQGVALLNVTQPSVPREVARVSILSPPYAQTNGVAVSDQALYTDREGSSVYRIGVATTYDTVLGMGVFRVFALNDPLPGEEILPRFIGGAILAADYSGVPTKVAIVDKYAYVTTLLLGIQIVDINKVIQPHLPSANVLAGAVDTTAQDGAETWPIDIKAIGTHVFALTRRLGLSSGELIAVDGSNPAIAQITDAVPLSRPNKLAVVGSVPIINQDGSENVKDLAFVSNGNQLQIIDVTDISQLVYLSTLTLEENIGNLTVDLERRLLYISQGVGKIQIVDLREIRNPKAVGTLAVATPGVLISEGGNLYIAEGMAGVKIAQLTEGVIRFEDQHQKQVIGAVTDGVTEVEVIVEGIEDTTRPVTLTLEDSNVPQLGGIGGWVDGTSRPATITVTPQVESGVIRAKAKYEVPKTFVRFGSNGQPVDPAELEIPERGVKVTAKQLTAQGLSITLANEQLILKRPPVLLVHGTWGGPETWEKFEPQLNQKNLFTVLSADYSKPQDDYQFSNVGSLAVNYPVIGIYVERLLDKLAGGGFAATKVDIVAHSLGGLVVRKYCAVQPTDCRNQIHKLITLDTPHLGTEVANWLNTARNTFPYTIFRDKTTRYFKGGFDGRALIEQAVGSPALHELANQALPVPWHLVAGQTPDRFMGYGVGFEVMWFAFKEFFDIVPDESFPLEEATYDSLGQEHIRTLTPLFGPGDDERGRNDRLVALYSQRFKIYNNSASLIREIDHITIHDKEEPINRVKFILESPTTSDLFYRFE